ncbi:MAG: hypothetical protein ACO3YO_01880 [Chthoniobacterales bacterium]|jgi:hypothetical protein
MDRAAILGIVAAALLAFGLLRLPIERSLDKAQREAFLRPDAPVIGLRDQLGQLSYAAALSGFRSLVAAFLWIEAHTAWEQTAWGRMAGLFRTVTSLQPRSLTYWDLSSWHMAWNAAIAARENPKEPSEFLRRRAEREYQLLGKEFLAEGLANNPDSFMLHERMGILLRDKFEDHRGAADAFAKAAASPQAPPYIKRLAAYELAAVEGREREAYAALRHIYEMGEEERKPRVLTLLHELEQKLGIPAAERRVPVAPE